MNQQTQLLFDQELANYVAALARLDPSHPDLGAIVADMQHILAMVQTMDEVDTSGVEPLRHPLELPGLTREDKVTVEESRDALLSNAPATEDGLFLVPAVLE